MVKTIQIQNRTMRYISFGTGNKNMVILPGLSIKYLTDSEQSIKRSFKIFEENYTVYLFDRVDNPPEGYTIYDMAEDTALAMQELNISDAYLFGASQGGMMGQCIAINHPELIKKIVLGSTASRFNEKGLKTVETWIRLSDEKNREKLADNVIEYIYSDKTVNKFGSILKSGLAQINEDEFKRFSTLVKACRVFDVYEDLDKIKASVFVIGCDGDKILGSESSIEITDKIGCQQYIYSKEYGHGVYDEAPDYRSRIKDFFEQE